ncbi:extensin family protein [Nitrobacter winogradskyi]|uniref:Uncharacterized protein n=1 Tax=Nitrobacter winogradskyi TaxID=913 RepID=A0ACC6ALH2_NITWI|nr:extensin family protein [Nitrobacter winogradskyi]MCP2000717.1 hypothetical protein [Nitrobacter winogradskyi]
MTFNARLARRKPQVGAAGRDRWVVAAIAILFMPAAVLAESRTPLPQPRPAIGPASDGSDSKHAVAPVTSLAPPAPSACRLALTDAVAIAPSIPAITGPGACGGADLVRLEAVVLPDRTRVPVKPAATLRCTMASAIADWVRADIAPLAERLGSRFSELDNFDSFECRGRNRVAGAKLSEHGHANALDVRSVRMSNGRTITLTDRNVPRELREKLLNSVCARFTTVLGPGSDGYHEDHIHLDLAERRNGYRICQWKIDDPMPEVAPLLPPERPAEASLRETAEEKNEKHKLQEGASERAAAASGAVSQASGDPPQLPAAVPIPQKRPFSGTRSGKVAEDKKPSSSASMPSTRLSAARSAKRKHKPRLDLPPFLRPLFN